MFPKKNNGLKVKNDVLMVDIKMQIGFADSIEKRFIDYANKIRVENRFADTWVVSFILKENLNDNNTVSLNKVDSEGGITVNNYEEIKLIEISLNHCCSLIKENKDIQILNQDK